MLDLVRIGSLNDYLGWCEASTETQRLRDEEERQLIQADEVFQIPAHCYVCNRARDLAVRFTREERESGKLPNWREHLLCRGCRLNARLRACFQLFDSNWASRYSSSIYLPEQRTPFYRLLQTRFPAVTGSEFMGHGFRPGQRNWRGLRHEDISCLSFREAGFDAILSFEVFEHVPDYATALRECFRCLRSPGLLMFTAPFLLSSQANVTRARQRPDGSIEHLLSPEYHTDPFGKRDILCFRHFGWQLLQELAEVGFRDCHGLLYWSRHFGYLGQESVVFFASK